MKTNDKSAVHPVTKTLIVEKLVNVIISNQSLSVDICHMAVDNHPLTNESYSAG